MFNTHYWTKGLKMVTDIMIKSKSWGFLMLIRINYSAMNMRTYSMPSSKIMNILRQSKKEKNKSWAVILYLDIYWWSKWSCFVRALKPRWGKLIFISLQCVSAHSVDGHDTLAKDLNSSLMSFGWWMLTKEQIIVRLVSLSLFLSIWAQTGKALFSELCHSPLLKTGPKVQIFLTEISKINLFSFS